VIVFQPVYLQPSLRLRPTA